MNKLPPKPPPGQRGKKRHPQAVGGQDPHDWGNPPGRNNQPSWLNGSAEGRVMCRRCGIEKKLGVGDINADHAGFGDEGRRLMAGKTAAKVFHYTDAKGRIFSTMQELGCPAFILDEMGAIRENRQMLRNVDDRVDYVDDRVGDVVDRLAALEAENAEMRARLEQRVDVTALVDWLSDMVAVAAAQKMQTVGVVLDDGRRAELPHPVANLILDLGDVREREKVPVQARGGSEESGNA